MKRIFSGITAQHAPMPRTARQALVLVLSGTLQTASQIPHCARLNSIFVNRNTSTSVTTEEKIDANRFSRSQRNARPLAPRPEEEAGARELCGVAVSDVIVPPAQCARCTSS